MIRSTDRLRTVLYALLWVLPLGYIWSQSIQMVPAASIVGKKISGRVQVVVPVITQGKLAPTKKAISHRTIKEERTTFVTRDGVRRNAILLLRENARGNVVLCHSAMHNKESMLPYAKQLFASFNCLTFDFRRHGEQIGRQYSTSGKKEIYEIEAAVKFLNDRSDTRDLPLYGFGVSMGAAYLIEAESKVKRFDGLILQSCFETLRKQIKRQYGFFRIPLMHNLIFREPILTIAARRHNLKLRKLYPMHSIAKVDTPILLIHAKNDDFISFEAFAKLRDNGKNVVQTWTPDDGRHTKILEMLPEEYLAQCEQFFAKLT